MTVADVFSIRGRGTVAAGRVEDGTLRVHDEVQINGGPPLRVDGIEAFRAVREQAATGEEVGLLFAGLGRDDISSGDVITSGGGAATAAPPAALGRDPRFDQAEAQRTQFLTMRDAGIMTDAQIDAALLALAFTVDGRRWLLKAGSDAWYSALGDDFKHDTPPS